MLRKLRVACLQVNAGEDWPKNLARIRKKLHEAAQKKVRLLALPEYFYWRGDSKDFAVLAREATPKVLREFRIFAAAHRMAILLGSVVEAAPEKNKFFNTSFLISEKGQIAGRYRKVHLFDIDLPRMKVLESRHIRAGRKAVAGKIWGIRAGLSVCYDLRFPELYRELAAQGCRILFVPANFTRQTGRAHWEILLRARAVENQAYVVAPGQSEANPATGIPSFGSSLIVDPWGKVLARAGHSGEGLIYAELDFAFQDRLRRNFPVLKHRRLG